MSTRCQVQVVQEGLGWNEAVTLYHHCDGYPSHMLRQILLGFERVKGTYKAGRAGKCAAALCAADDSFEPEAGHELHGDIEFYYRVFAMNASGGSMAETGRWEVEIYDPTRDGTPENPGPRFLTRTEITEAAAQASEIEERFYQEAR